MSIQTHPGLPRVGTGVSGTLRGGAAPSRRTWRRRRTASVLAAVVIDMIVAVAFVVMDAGIAGEHNDASDQPGSAPFVTPAPEAPPTPRPGF